MSELSAALVVIGSISFLSCSKHLSLLYGKRTEKINVGAMTFGAETSFSLYVLVKLYLLHMGIDYDHAVAFLRNYLRG